ncbi:MAG: hypothetical protein WAM60_13815 [Candidatus Promineifilaceae bacterium]
MHTILLQSKPRKDGSGKVSFTIEALGESPIQDAVKEAIKGLEHHPAVVSRRSLLDVMALIERFNFQIRYTEHYFTEDNLEGWMFILQG